MKTILVFAAFIGMIIMSNNAYGQKTVKSDTALMIGKILKEPFVHNKPVEGVYDYFFQAGDKKYFVKTYKAKYSKGDLDKWVGQYVEVKIIVKQGTWDDNGEGQSRTGEYILLFSIKKA
ncbi:MAG: hypothetical protein ACLQQ4_07815 [Bacteroidia bacterium]